LHAARQNGDTFYGIATFNGRKAKFAISFIQDTYINIARGEIKELDTLSVKSLWINDKLMYGVTLVPGRNRTAQPQTTEIVNPNDLLADIFLNSSIAQSPKQEAVTEEKREDESAISDDNYNNFTLAIDRAVLELIRGKKPTFEDMASVEDEEMTVYMRAWKDKDFYIIRGYQDDTWQNQESFLARFWTKDSSMDFDSEVKVGSTLSNLSSFFGDMLYNSSAEGNSNEYAVLGDGTGVTFEIESDRIKSITYMVEFPFSDKMRQYLGLE